VKGEQSNRKVRAVVTEAMKSLAAEAAAAKLPFKDVMVKRGLSWGGEDVIRLSPSAVPKYIVQKMIPKLPAQASEATILIQTKVDLVGELRWAVIDGELSGRQWQTFKEVSRGNSAVTGGFRSPEEGEDALTAAGLTKDEASKHQLEESMRGKVQLVVNEAIRDAGGEVPQYLRVDLLVDRQGRAWLGERESWGADLAGKDTPKKPQLAKAIIARACRLLSCQRRGKSLKPSPRPAAVKKQDRDSASSTGGHKVLLPLMVGTKRGWAESSSRSAASKKTRSTR